MLSLRSCLDARRTVLSTVEQVFLPMGKDIQCTVRGERRPKGREKFCLKFFLSCPKIRILFHSWNNDLIVNLAQFWGITDLSWVVSFPWDLSVVMSAGVLEDRRTEHPWRLLTGWFVCCFGRELSRNTCACPLNVAWASHSMVAGRRTVKGYTQNWQSHSGYTLSPVQPQGLSIFNGMKKLAPVAWWEGDKVTLQKIL